MQVTHDSAHSSIASMRNLRTSSRSPRAPADRTVGFLPDRYCLIATAWSLLIGGAPQSCIAGGPRIGSVSFRNNFVNET
jgi:hypothetical protein